MVGHSEVRSAFFERASPFPSHHPPVEAHGRLPAAPVTPPWRSAGSAVGCEGGPSSPVGSRVRIARRSRFYHAFGHCKAPSHSKWPAFDPTATPGSAVMTALMCIKAHLARLQITFAVFIAWCHTMAPRNDKAMGVLG